MSTDEGQRAAEPGELCQCGRAAVLVFLGGQWGPVGYCGLSDGGAGRRGVCTFCGDTIDHAFYWRAEETAGRQAPPGVGDGPQDAPCPQYRLRITDPPPAVNAGSVRPFDPERDRREHSEQRLHAELLGILLAAGLDHDATYLLTPDDDPSDDLGRGDSEEAPTGDLADAVDDLVFDIGHALRADPDHAAGYDPQVGQIAVAVMLRGLRARLAVHGTTPNPADLDGATVLARVGGDVSWSETVGYDRPLLVARRAVHRALDPEAPDDIYRPWIT